MSATANSTYVAPVLPVDGRLGHLTQEQTVKLQQFWVRLYDIFDGKTPFDQTAPSSFKGQARDEEGGDGAPAPAKTGWFGRGKAASETAAAPAPRFTGAELHKTFWKLTMMDHPDLIVLKVMINESTRSCFIDKGLMILRCLGFSDGDGIENSLSPCLTIIVP